MQPTRRTVLASSLVGAAAVGVASSHGAQAATKALKATPASADPVRHAVSRLTFGATPELLDHVRKVGVSSWLDDQLNPSTDLNGTLTGLGFSSLPVSLPPTVSMQVDSTSGRNPIADLQVATFARAAWGDNQVFELMVEFWTNHFSILAAKVGIAKVNDDQQVIRKHALGSFADMLAASMQSPAMLYYLDNAYSIGHQPNENYARELLELHTVGVNGGYTQKDVHSAALALTGLTIDSQSGGFLYKPEWHANGPVTVMGWHSDNNTGSSTPDVALSLATYLAHHPKTAQRIATKLVRRLVSDSPPASLVASAAAVFRANDTQIVPVIKHIVASAEFAHSVGQKSQRPFDWLVAGVRGLGIKANPDFTTNGASIIYRLENLGQAPFEWSPPNGYPDNVFAYASTATMLSRWNSAQMLVYGSLSDMMAMDGKAVLGTPAPTTAGAIVTRLTQRLFGVAPRGELATAVLTGVGVKAATPVTADRAASLALPIAALLLSSPEAMVR